MYSNTKKLIQLRTKLEFYKKLEKKINKVFNDELDLEHWLIEVEEKIKKIDIELDDLKLEMNLSDEQWDEDETK